MATNIGESNGDKMPPYLGEEEVTPMLSSDLDVSHGGQEMEVKEEFSDAEKPKRIKDKPVTRVPTRPGSLGRLHRASFHLAHGKEDEFSVSDIVWGKVRSHPWWPGQIFDPSDSSKKAMKHHKKECFLVAYFADRTFAWNEASQLKPFMTHFSLIEKQSNSEVFQHAVNCALEEVSRRAEFGLACSCIPKNIYDKIKFQNVENTGIRKESSQRYGVDKSSSVRSFKPDKLIAHLQTLSEFPSGGIDRLELVIAKAQLLAFYRFKGCHCLPEFQDCGALPDNDTYTLSDGASPLCKNDDQTSRSPSIFKRQNNFSHKRKHNLKEGMYPTNKERSLTELMDGTPDSPDSNDGRTSNGLSNPTSCKKRKAAEYCANHSVTNGGRKTISLAKVSSTTHLPNESFRVGECISRVASQLTGSPSVFKSYKDMSKKLIDSYDELAGNGSEVSFQISEDTKKESWISPTEYSSLADLLSLLQLSAQEPLNNYSFLNVVVSFFSDFRNSILLGNSKMREIIPIEKVGNKRKRASTSGLPETFEFEDMSDTYWKDKVIESGSEEQPLQRNRKREYQPAIAEPENPLQISHRSCSRKRYSDDNHAEDKPAGYVDENSPAELIMNFAELDSVPSETNLNKMFRRFGPLREPETEVDRESSQARVVFKKCSDAEVAFSSAIKFNIFGRTQVNYQLGYTPSALFKASSATTAQDQEMHLDLSTLHAPWTITSLYDYPQPATQEQVVYPSWPICRAPWNKLPNKKRGCC